jgi:hypothetical protein
MMALPPYVRNKRSKANNSRRVLWEVKSRLTRNVCLLVQHDFNIVCNEFDDTNRMPFERHFKRRLSYYFGYVSLAHSYSLL